jgi:hypothetical protein
VLIINSASFRDSAQRPDDVRYLADLRARLKPSGCLVLHTDWLEPDHWDRAGVERLFQDAGFVAPAREIAQPGHVPSEAIRYDRATFGLREVPLRKGFVLVFGVAGGQCAMGL